MKKLTIEDLNARINKEFKIISYKNSANIILKHQCGYEFKTCLANFESNGQKCPKCTNSIRKYDIDFLKKYITEIDSEYTLQDDTFVNNKVKMKFIHNRCNQTFEMRLNDFVTGHRCPKCQHSVFSTEDYREKIKKETNDEYELLSEYCNDRTKVRIKHKKCQKEFLIAPVIVRKHKYKNFCLHCFRSERTKMTMDVFIEKLNKVYNGKFTVKEPKKKFEYNQSIELVHNTEICGASFESTPNKILHSTVNCPFCEGNSSKGEKLIYSFLMENGYNFKYQYFIAECKDQRSLPFDFAVFKDSNKDEILCLIEYDGWQHFNYRKSSKFFNSPERLLKIQEHDRIKDKYCIDKNIPLLRISYKDFKKTNSIVKKFLDKFNDYPLDAEMHQQE